MPVWSLPGRQSDLAIKLIFGRDNRAGVVAGVSGAFSNLVFLGMPLMLGVFGQEGFAILSLIVAIHMPIMMAASITLHEIAMRRDGVFAGEGHFGLVVLAFFKSLLRNPFVLGILAGWIWRLTGLRMPVIADSLIQTLGSVAGPVALFAMGMGLKKFGVTGHIAASLVDVGDQVVCDARGRVSGCMVHRIAALHREDCSGFSCTSRRCELLSDSNALRYGAGACFEFHGHGYRIVGHHHGILDFGRYTYFRLSEACCSFGQKGAG